MKTNVQVTGPYMLNFATGKMELMEKAGQLQRGQKVYAFGGGMCEQVFAVVNPDTRELVEVGKPEDVEAWDLDNYFSPLTKYDSYIRPISKKFGIGLYYAENEPLYSDEVITESIERAKKIETMKQQREQQKKEASAKNKAELMKKYDFLKVVGDRYDYKEAVTNLKKLLKHEFPGVKFSVKRRYKGSDSVDISWTDGPTAETVENVAMQFKGVTFNAYDDSTDVLTTDFNTLFGSLDYIFTERDYSEEVSKAEGAKVIVDYPILADGKEHDKMDILDAYGLKDKAEHCLRWFSVASVRRARLMDRDLTVRSEKAIKPEQPTAKAEGLQVVDYSEKAVAVVGDTKPHAEKLKELGGRFNARLKCGAGWIFSKKKEAAVRAAFGL